MPAERSKSSRRSGADGNQLVWTIPVEPANIGADGITFAPNVTPVTFDDGPPPLVDAPPCEYILFPPSDECHARPRRPGHSKKKPDDHIPRPPNAFILFRSSFIKGQHVPTEVETNHSTLSKIIGLTWKNLRDDERQLWHSRAKAALDEHKRKFPQYAFRPTQGRGKGGTEKRKVREVGPKDHKRCAKIAELLVEGKKGQELDAAIQEFDKHHVPEIVTRFEAPLTARMYRRSSSVPIPEGDDSSRRSSRKDRASSTQPAVPSLSISTAPYPEQQTKQEDAPHTPYLQSFDQFAFSQSTPSFDLNTFSFDDRSSPLPDFSCDPFSAPVSPLDNNHSLFNTNELVNPTSPHLSIDTSYLAMDDWTRCSSPMSAASSSMPATPSYIDSPSPGAYGTFNDSVESFERSLASSFGDFDLPKQYDLYPSNGDSHFSGSYTNADSPSEYPSFEQHHSKTHMASQDLDFSAFMMASLPEYSI